MPARRHLTMQQRLTQICPDYIAAFIIWYSTDESKRQPFDEFKKRWQPNMKTYDQCLEWLTRDDAQEAMVKYKKEMHRLKMMEIYDTMVNKALEGDVNAAKWVENFTNSDFFDESTDEINDFLNEVKLPKKKKE